MNEIVRQICSVNRKNVAEIGVLSGKISGRLLSYNDSIEKLYMIDPWTEYVKIGQENSKDKRLVKYTQDEWEKIYINACNTVKKFNNRAEIIRKTSVEASNIFEDNFFDVIIIDADHTYKPLVTDFLHWIPKIKNGGLLYGHDYSSGWHDVVNAVNAIFIEDFIRIENNYYYIIINDYNRELYLERSRKCLEDI